VSACVTSITRLSRSLTFLSPSCSLLVIDPCRPACPCSSHPVLWCRLDHASESVCAIRRRSASTQLTVHATAAGSREVSTSAVRTDDGHARGTAHTAHAMQAGGSRGSANVSCRARSLAHCVHPSSISSLAAVGSRPSPPSHPRAMTSLTGRDSPVSGQASVMKLQVTAVDESSESAAAAATSSRPTAPRILSAGDPGRYALLTLTLINLLNYVDRYVPSATKQYFQADLHLSDTETSIPLTAFVFVYMVCSPVFSWLADLGYKRSRLIAAGVLVWSIATAAGALAVNFWTLLVSRSLVGVGEAAYATIAPGTRTRTQRTQTQTIRLCSHIYCSSRVLCCSVTQRLLSCSSA
jgi:hypothetical protein